MSKFWILIAAILVDAILCIVFGILWVRAKSLRRFEASLDPFADDSYAVAERDRKNFQARGLAVLAFVGVLALSLCGLWQFGLFDDLEVSLAWVISIVAAVMIASILLAAILGQMLMSTGSRSSQDQEPVSWEVEGSWSSEETPLWHSEDLDHEQVRDSAPFAHRTVDRLSVGWRLAILLVVLLGYFVCSYLDSKLPDEFRIEFLEALGLKGLLGLLPLFIIVLGLFIIFIARKRGRRGQRRPGVDYLWDKVVEEPPVPAEIPDWVRQLAPPEVGQGM